MLRSSAPSGVKDFCSLDSPGKIGDNLEENVDELGKTEKSPRIRSPGSRIAAMERMHVIFKAADFN